jgi:K319-like protein
LEFAFIKISAVLLLSILLIFSVLPTSSSSAATNAVRLTKRNIYSNIIIPVSHLDIFNQPATPIAYSQSDCTPPSDQSQPPSGQAQGPCSLFSDIPCSKQTYRFKGPLAQTQRIATLYTPGPSQDNTCNNEPPIADAGPDQSIDNIDKPITLDGSNSYDPNGGQIKSYSWSQIEGGPSVVLNDPSSPKPEFTISGNDPHEGELAFQLTVTNENGVISSPSQVHIKLNCLVDIWASAFLPPWTPNGRVPNPAPMNFIIDPETHRPYPHQSQLFDFHAFSTDMRNFPQKGGSARQWNYVVIDLCSSHKPAEKQLHGVGQSHGFKMEWQPPDYNKLVEVEYTARASAGGMQEGPFYSCGDGCVQLYIKGATPIPFIKLAPDIDYSYSIHLQKEKDTLDYYIRGTNDGFPAYELFIGSHPVHFVTPKKVEGQNPLNPLGPGRTLIRLFPFFPSIQVEIPPDGGDGQMPMSEAYDSNFVPPSPTQAAEPITRASH